MAARYARRPKWAMSLPDGCSRQLISGGRHNGITQQYDAIVIGLGGMGSATLYQLAKRGKRVLGIEQFGIAHELGSSHGVTRIIRLAYHEHPSYVPLMRRAYELWRDLEAKTEEQILHITGSIDAGPPDGSNFKGSLLSCEEHDLPHDVLTSAEITKRFPGYRLPSETMAVFQGEGGFLLPERCISLFVEQAQSPRRDCTYERAHAGVASNHEWRKRAHRAR